MIQKCVLKVIYYQGVKLNFFKWLVYIGINYTRKESNHTSNQGCSRKLYYDNGNNDNNGKDHYKY